MDFLTCIDKEIESKELKASILVFDLSAAKDGVSNNMIHLLIVLTPQITKCLPEKILKHHDRTHFIVALHCLEDTVVGEMDFFV